MHHIREVLPDLKLKIAQQLQKSRVELGELGDQVNDSDTYLVRTSIRSDSWAAVSAHRYFLHTAHWRIAPLTWHVLPGRGVCRGAGVLSEQPSALDHHRVLRRVPDHAGRLLGQLVQLGARWRYAVRHATASRGRLAGLTSRLREGAQVRSVCDGHGPGARISFVFHEIFANGIRELDPFDQVSDADIRTILYNAAVCERQRRRRRIVARRRASTERRLTLRARGGKAVDVTARTHQGASPSLFVSGQSFEVLVRLQIKRLEDPAAQCVQMVYDELLRILAQLEQRKAFKRFPLLKERFHAAVITFFKRAMDPTLKLVSDLIKCVMPSPPPPLPGR